MGNEVFEALLEVSRALRRRRRKRLARLVGASGRRHAQSQADGIVDVRAVRALTGLSQAKFAELLGIELATLRNWEQGRRLPDGPGARAAARDTQQAGRGREGAERMMETDAWQN